MKLTIHTKHTSQPDGVYPVAHTCSLSRSNRSALAPHSHLHPPPTACTPPPSTYSPYPSKYPPPPPSKYFTYSPLRCFFSLELPAYSSAAHCYDRLLYAITHCTQIDIDTTTAARENRDRDDGED